MLARKSGSISNAHSPNRQKYSVMLSRGQEESPKHHSTYKRRQIMTQQPEQTRPIQLRAKYRDICPVHEPDAVYLDYSINPKQYLIALS